MGVQGAGVSTRGCELCEQVRAGGREKHPPPQEPRDVAKLVAEPGPCGARAVWRGWGFRSTLKLASADSCTLLVTGQARASLRGRFAWGHTATQPQGPPGRTPQAPARPAPVPSQLGQRLPGNSLTCGPPRTGAPREGTVPRFLRVLWPACPHQGTLTPPSRHPQTPSVGPVWPPLAALVGRTVSSCQAA